MKTDFSSLDTAIMQVLTERPSPSQSADITVNHRMQAMRRNGRVADAPATDRWKIAPPQPLASTGFASQAD